MSAAKRCDLCLEYYPRPTGVEYRPYVAGPSTTRLIKMAVTSTEEDLCPDCLMRALSAIVAEHEVAS